MRLTCREKNLLSGKEGPVKALAMSHLVKLGEAFDAEEMVDITYAHMSSGSALRSGDIDEDGILVAKGHPREGCSVADCILIYPEAKGSSAGCMMLHWLAKRGRKPAGIVNTQRLDPNLVEGAILADIPLLCCPEQDVYKWVATGDRVEIDGQSGLLVKM